MPNSINQDSMRDLNLKSMLQFLFNHPNTSRIDIANHLNLNKSTITSLFNELNTKDYITELGQGLSTGNGGRKPTLIKFNHNYGYTINFELGHHHLRTMTNWLDGEKIKFSTTPIINLTIREIVDVIKDHIRRAMVPNSLNGLLGISIAVNGIVFNNKIIDSPFIDMEDIDLVKELNEFNLPIILENEANLAAIATRDFTTSSEVKNLVALNIHNGIGSGIIIDDNLYRGINGAAGEIGRTIFYPRSEKFGTVTPIEQEFSEDAIINKLKIIKNKKYMDRNNFIHFYRQNDKDAIKLINSLTRAIAFIVYNIKQAFNPELISLQSRIIGEIPELMSDINNNYYKLTNSKKDYGLRLSPMIEDAPLYGGASVLTHNILNLDKYTLYLKN